MRREAEIILPQVKLCFDSLETSLTGLDQLNQTWTFRFHGSRVRNIDVMTSVNWKKIMFTLKLVLNRLWKKYQLVLFYFRWKNKFTVFFRLHLPLFSHVLQRFTAVHIATINIEITHLKTARLFNTCVYNVDTSSELH